MFMQIKFINIITKIKTYELRIKPDGKCLSLLVYTSSSEVRRSLSPASQYQTLGFSDAGDKAPAERLIQRQFKFNLKSFRIHLYLMQRDYSKYLKDLLGSGFLRSYWT